MESVAHTWLTLSWNRPPLCPLTGLRPAAGLSLVDVSRLCAAAKEPPEGSEQPRTLWGRKRGERAGSWRDRVERGRDVSGHMWSPHSVDRGPRPSTPHSGPGLFLWHPVLTALPPCPRNMSREGRTSVPKQVESGWALLASGAAAEVPLKGSSHEPSNPQEVGLNRVKDRQSAHIPFQLGETAVPRQGQAALARDQDPRDKVLQQFSADNGQAVQPTEASVFHSADRHQDFGKALSSSTILGFFL